MNPKNIYKHGTSHQGFSLIELLITLVITSLMGIFIMQFMGSSLSRSFNPIRWVQESFTLRKAMNNILSDYKDLRNKPLFNLSQVVTTISSSKYDPLRNQGISFSSRFILFSEISTDQFAEASCTGNCRILKVTVRGAGQELTALFTQ